MAGVRGFEPRNAGIRIQCLTAWRYPKSNARRCRHTKYWLGYEDSNLGMLESESSALPLGDTPIIKLNLFSLKLKMVATTGFEPVTP